MDRLKNAGKVEQKLFTAINYFLCRHPKLLDFVFDPKKPRLRKPPEKLLIEGRYLSSGEYLMVRVAMDLWSGSGNAKVYELIENLDPENFKRVLKAIIDLGPKPSARSSFDFPDENCPIE
jgi:hypothetical protein